MAEDVCEVLELGNVTEAISGLDPDDLSQIEVIDSMGRGQSAYVVTEALRGLEEDEKMTLSNPESHSGVQGGAGAFHHSRA